MAGSLVNERGLWHPGCHVQIVIGQSSTIDWLVPKKLDYGK